MESRKMKEIEVIEDVIEEKRYPQVKALYKYDAYGMKVTRSEVRIQAMTVLIPLPCLKCHPIQPILFIFIFYTQLICNYFQISLECCHILCLTVVYLVKFKNWANIRNNQTCRFFYANLFLYMIFLSISFSFASQSVKLNFSSFEFDIQISNFEQNLRFGCYSLNNKIFGQYGKFSYLITSEFLRNH